MILDLTFDDIIIVIKKQLSKYNFNYALIYLTYFNMEYLDKKYQVTYYHHNNAIKYKDYTKFVISDSGIDFYAILKCTIEYFNNNKDILLDEICRYITNDIIADIKVYETRQKHNRIRDRHANVLQNIETHIRDKKLKIAMNI